MAEEIEVDVGAVEDLAPGTMKEIVTIEGDSKSKVLLVRLSDGSYQATGHRCTHYGAPLAKGALAGDRILCPWHAACFNACTGDIEDAPALDAIHKFPCSAEGGRVKVTVPTTFPDYKRTPRMAAPSSADTRTFLVVGGGPAAVAGAQSLREAGFTGRVRMLTREATLPYDRIKLTKALGTPAERLLLRPASFYEEAGIEVTTGANVTAIDTSGKSVTLADGSTVGYDKLLLATGADARVIPFPGHDLGGVMTIRNPEDNAALAEAVAGGLANVVVVGSSFIGMEAAAMIARKVADGGGTVTVVGMEEAPFEFVLGKEIGAAVRAAAEGNGVKFHMNATVTRFVDGGSGRVGSVEVGPASGEGATTTLPADLVILGVGAAPTSPFRPAHTKAAEDAPAPPVTIERDGAITVDAGMRAVGVEDGSLFVAGDLARFPFWAAGGALTRIEHWDVAQQQGRLAARNMAAAEGSVLEEYRDVPFFWTAAFGVAIRYTGHGAGWDASCVEGDVEAKKFIVYYAKGDRVVAAATVGADPAAVAISSLMRAGVMPSFAEVHAKGAGTVEALQERLRALKPGEAGGFKADGGAGGAGGAGSA